MYKRAIKRWLDIIISGVGLVLLSPVFLVLIIVVRIGLGSPVIFKQERPGKNEKIFKIKKFRTMTNKRDSNGELLPDKDRLTALGKFLRSTSLDELPELWNIFVGEMSFVGPRPLITAYLPYYNEQEKRRHEVLPGLTGLAQVRGRNNLTWEQKFEYDIEYVDKCSFRLDLKIFFETIGKVIKRADVISDGEYRIPDFDKYRAMQNERSNQEKNKG